MARTVLSFGETLWDLLPAGPQLGGAPCNFAARIAALGNRSVLVTRVGTDDLGRRAEARMAELGIDPAGIQRDPERPTGTVEVRLRPGGSPEYVIRRGVAYDRIEPPPAFPADAVCFGTLAQREAPSREALRRTLEGAPRAVKLLDLNLRPDCWTPEVVDDSLRRADGVKLNDEESEVLAGLFGLPGAGGRARAEAMMRRWGLAFVVVTLGSDGAAAFEAGGRAFVPGAPVEVVDTVGSGDAFAAGFLHARLEGRPAAECLRLGNALGALAAARAGATAPIGAEEVAAFLRFPPPPPEPSDRTRFWAEA